MIIKIKGGKPIIIKQFIVANPNIIMEEIITGSNLEFSPRSLQRYFDRYVLWKSINSFLIK